MTSQKSNWMMTQNWKNLAEEQGNLLVSPSGKSAI